MMVLPRGDRRAGKMALCWSALVFTLIAMNGCERGADDVQPDAGAEPAAAAFEFREGIARVTTATDTHHVNVEIAERDDQRSFGLMERTSLAEDAGMIFLYESPQPADAGFWMYRTRIPLDIAFFDTTGRIVAILQMQPCTSPDPNRCRIEARDYSPGAPYIGALEVNRGWFGAHGVRVGDAIELVR